MTQTASTAIEKLDPNFALEKSEDGLQWYDIRAFGVEGRAYDDTKSFYDRWPARAEGVVPAPVWELGLRSAGMYTRFVTNADRISARWSLRHANLAMNHMPASGVSGLDLYGLVDGHWRFAGTGIPSKFPDNEAVLINDMDIQSRQFMLNLPLYNGVTSVAIGVPHDAVITKAPKWNQADTRPILFYGTSIVQGGCASRTGMAYPAIISRRLHRPHINMGFSGNGRCEEAVARLLAEIDPCAYVIDPLPNMVHELVTERMELFVNILRAARPKTPIVLVENIWYQQWHFHRARRDRFTTANRALRAAHDRLVAAGVTGLHYVEGRELLGDDTLATVDGTHPTDVGFMRQADAIAPVLQRIL